MAEIEESQRRIAAALSRIDAGVEGLLAQDTGQSDRAERDALKIALDEERVVSAQLQERLASLTAQHAEELANAKAVPAPSVEAIDVELQNLKQVVQSLRETNQALREAQAVNVTEPQLINQALVTEMEALRAERAAEVAETTAILSALEPLLAGAKENV